MRRILLLGLLALVVNDAGAQRGGGWGGGGFGGRGAGAGGFGRGGVGLGRARAGYGYGSGYGYGLGYGMGGYGLGYGYLGDYGDDYFGYVPQPVIVPPPQQPVVAPVAATPAREVHPVVTSYTWPAAGASESAAPAEGEAQAFGIVLKDGSTLSATAVVASGDGLQYVDQDDRHLRISMSAVDRAATLKLNRERKLNLYLPAASQ